MSKCLDDIIEFAKETLPDVSKRTLSEMDKRFQKILSENPELSPAEKQNIMGMIVENEIIRRAEQNRAARLMDLETTTKGVKILLDPSQSLAKNAVALLTGNSTKMIEAGNRGIRATSMGYQARFLNRFLFAIDKSLDLLRKGGLARELVYELNGINSGSVAAANIAKVFKNTLNQIFELKKSVNPYLEKINDYFYRQTHDRDKIVKAGFDAWSDFIKRRYSKKSFLDLTPEQVDERLRAIYDSIDDDNYSLSFSRKSGDKTYQMARERSLIPDDADAFFEYHQLFGRGTLFDVMVETIKKASNDVAVMERLGSNPVDNFQRMLDQALTQGGEAARKSYASKQARIENTLYEALGFSNVPAKNMAAKATKFMLAWQGVSKLGTVSLSLIDDLGKAISMLQASTGDNYISIAGKLTYQYMKAFISPQFAKNAAQYLWTFHDTYLGKLTHEMGGLENSPGTMGKLMKFMSYANFLDAHHRAARTSIGIVLGQALGDNAHLPYAQLDPAFKQHGLFRYGIGENEWELIRRATYEFKPQEVSNPYFKKILTPEAIEQVSDEAVSKYLVKTGKDVNPSNINKARQTLSGSLGAFINDMVDIGTSTPGAAERAFLFGGTDINSGLGQALRLIFQFKSVGLKNLNTSQRLAYSGPDPSRLYYAGMAKYAGAGLVLYAMKKWGLAALSNKTPEDPSDPDFVVGALGSIVGGNPLTDNLIHTAQMDDSPYMKKLKSGLSLLGPTAGDAANLAQLGFSIADLFADRPKTEIDEIGGQIARMAANSPLGAPFKLPYTKSLGEYYIFSELQQIGNPKFLRNEARRMGRDEGGPLQKSGLWPQQEYFMLDPRNK